MVTATQESVLGSMLIDDQCIPFVMAEIEPSDFSDETYRLIFTAIRSLFRAGKTVDPVTVLGTFGDDERDRLYDLVKQLMIVTPTAANIREYVSLLREEGKHFRVKKIAEALCESKSMGEAKRLIENLAGVAVDKAGFKTVTMAEGLQRFIERQETKPKYLSWGISELDKRLFIEPGDFCIIGGYPSSGKTAFALNAAWTMAETDKVGFFSLETGDAKLMDRLVAHVALLSMGKIKRRELAETDYSSVAALSDRFVNSKLEIIPAAHMTADDILMTAKARQYKTIFIDYIQLISPGADGRRDNRTNQVSEISRTLHVGAQSAGITIVALSQLSRPERTGGKQRAPRMSDLRESGQLEQDADTIMLLYRENSDNPDSRRVLSVEKNKEGQLGQMYLAFDGDTQTFRRHWDQRPDARYEGAGFEDLGPVEVPF